MSDRKLLFLGIIGIIGIMVLSYVIFPGAKHFSSVPNENEDVISEDLNTNSGILGTESQEIKIEVPSYTENVLYPKIVNMKNTENQDRANEKIEEFAHWIISNFEEQLGVETEDIKESLLTQYLVTFINESLISISFSISEDMGGAHPNNYIRTFNYDMGNGTELELGDMFKKDVDYMKIVGDICREKLLAQFGSDESLKAWIEEGTMATTGQFHGFEDFTITGGSLVIYFDPYEVGPYAMGIQMVEIDFTEIEQYLDSEGILKELI